MIYNSVSFYSSYKMNSAVWTSYYNIIKKSHENLIQYFNYYTKNKNNKEYYISLWREKAWAVKLPIKIKPKVQFFFFKTYESKEKALKEAIKYRDFKLNNWLKENELI